MIDEFRLAVRTLPPASAVVLASTYLTAMCVVLDTPPLLRVPVATAWALVIPGLAWARLLRAGDRGDTLTIAVVLSLAAGAVVGGLLALAGIWDAVAAFGLLAIVAVLGVVAPATPAEGGPTDDD